MSQVIKLRRTVTPDNPPPTLEEGELAAGLADYPIRMWIGTPSGVQELFAGAAIEDAETDAVYGRSDGKWVKVPIVGSVTPTFDADFPNVSLLIGNNSPPSGTTTVLDQSSQNSVISAAGATFYADTSLPNLTSTVWVGNPGVQAAAAAADFSANDFCVEGFHYRYLAHTFASAPSAVWIGTSSASQMRVAFSSTGIANDWDILDAQLDISSVALYAWYHWAVYRRAGVFYGAINGNVVTLGTSAAAIASPTSLQLWAGTAGYHAALRITKGASRYTGSNFARPVPPFESSGDVPPPYSLFWNNTTDQLSAWYDNDWHGLVAEWAVNMDDGEIA